MCGGELPADDAARVGVDDEREEHQALPAAQVGQVGDPQPIGRLDREVALDEVGAAVRARVGAGGPPRLPAALGPDDPVGAHEALHAARAGPARRRLSSAFHIRR